MHFCVSLSLLLGRKRKYRITPPADGFLTNLTKMPTIPFPEEYPIFHPLLLLEIWRGWAPKSAGVETMAYTRSTPCPMGGIPVAVAARMETKVTRKAGRCKCEGSSSQIRPGSSAGYGDAGAPPLPKKAVSIAKWRM